MAAPATAAAAAGIVSTSLPPDLEQFVESVRERSLQDETFKPPEAVQSAIAQLFRDYGGITCAEGRKVVDWAKSEITCASGKKRCENWADVMYYHPGTLPYFTQAHAMTIQGLGGCIKRAQRVGKGPLSCEKFLKHMYLLAKRIHAGERLTEADKFKWTVSDIKTYQHRVSE